MTKYIAWLEDCLLCLLLTVMVLLACLQIVLRQGFSGGFLWAEPLLRNLVLWAGMIGAVVATRKGKHIAMDVMSYLLPAHAKLWLQLLIHFFSLLVSAVLTWASAVFVRNEAIMGGQELLAVPSWVWVMIFPVAFSLISFHFGGAAVCDVLRIVGKLPPQGNSER